MIRAFCKLVIHLVIIIEKCLLLGTNTKKNLNGAVQLQLW